MDEVVKKVAALGLPVIILVVTMAATGFTGAAGNHSASCKTCRSHRHYQDDTW
jgi:hypothetical protein